MGKYQRNGLQISLAVIMSLSLTWVILLQSLTYCCFNRQFYQDNFRKLQTSTKVDIDAADLNKSVDCLFDYLLQRRDDLNLQVRLLSSGQKTEMFNRREKDHMVDVKSLLQRVMFSQKAALTVFVLLFLLLPFLYRRAAATSWTDYLLSYRAGFIGGIVTALLFIAIIAVFAACDFSTFWWKFHELLFTNDLWQLDPAESRLINLVEGEFFSNLVQYIISVTVTALVVAYALILLVLRILLKLSRKLRTLG